MIVSPIPHGSGAFVVHSALAQYLPNYKVVACSPKRSFFPPAFYPLGRDLPAKVIHAVPESAIFHRRKGVPLVVTAHGFTLDKSVYPHSSPLQNFHAKTDLWWLYQQAARRADVLTTVSHATAEALGEAFGITQPIKVIYNGVDETLFVPVEPREDGEVRVLFSGNAKRRKGVQWLLPILAGLEESISIHYTAGLQEQAAVGSHPRLRALGRVAHPAMPKLYQSMDILLLPSVTEGHSIAVLEAMASGLPVVASDLPALREQIVHGEGGFLCPVGNVEAFAAAIQTLADDAALRLRMGAFNRAQVETRFRLTTTVAAYQALFNDIG